MMDDLATTESSRTAKRGDETVGATARDRDLARWAVIALVLLGVGLRVKHYVAANPYWHDEASIVVNLFEKDARQLLGRLDMAQAAPPGTVTRCVDRIQAEPESASRCTSSATEASQMPLKYCAVA